MGFKKSHKKNRKKEAYALEEYDYKEGGSPKLPSKKKEIPDYDDISLEDLIEEESNTPEVPVRPRGLPKENMSEEVANYRVNSSVNKRREHLTTKADILERQKEENKAKANRKLLTGIMVVILFTTFTAGIYLAFPSQMMNMYENIKYQVIVNVGGFLNTDIQNKIHRDVGSKMGLEKPTRVSENLNKKNMTLLTELDQEFVSDATKKFVGENKNSYPQGNYLVGRDIRKGYYYGDKTKITVYRNIEDFSKGKGGDSKILMGDITRINSGEILVIDEVGEFYPSEAKMKLYKSASEIEDKKMYNVGVDIRPDNYLLKSASSSGSYTLESIGGIRSTVNYRGKTEVKLRKGEFISFVGLGELEPHEEKSKPTENSEA